MLNEWTYWQKALAIGNGRRLTKAEAGALGITSEPQTGFYRKRNKGGQDIPVAIWNNGGSMVAKIGPNMGDADDIWTWVCDWPISEEVYRAVAESGKAWGDDPPVAEAKPGHNLPDDPHEALKMEFAAEKELADKFLASAITTQEQADQAAVWSKRLKDIFNRADKLFREKKDPIVAAGKAVDEEYRWRNEADGYSTKLKRHLDAFLQKQLRKERKRQEAVRREEERLRREAEELARKAAESDQLSEAERNAAKEEAERLQREAEAKAKEAEARNASAGRTGAKVSLRMFPEPRITDYDALLIALKDRPEIREVVEILAKRAAKSGVSLPGMEIVEVRRAA